MGFPMIPKPMKPISLIILHLSAGHKFGGRVITFLCSYFPQFPKVGCASTSENEATSKPGICFPQK
jgi:hypothetical protein